MNVFWERCRIKIAGLAMVAILLQALLPNVINASAPKQFHLAEICTAIGIKKITAPDSSPSDNVPAFAHCKICLLGDLVSLPPPLVPPRYQPSDTVASSIGAADTPIYSRARLYIYARGPPPFRTA